MASVKCLNNVQILHDSRPPCHKFCHLLFTFVLLLTDLGEIQTVCGKGE